MVLPLRYGEPPELDDCVDIGTFDVDSVLDNYGRFKGFKELYDLYGQPLPPIAIVRQALMQAREIDILPITGTIPGLGRLVVGVEGWEVL